MNTSRNHKKRLIVSYKNLSEELLERFKEAYPEGYKDYIQKTIKPNGEPIFVVPLETDDTSYMIKIEVKIDSALAANEEMDKDFYGDDEDKDMDFDTLDSIDKDSDNIDHTEHHLHHGDYEDSIETNHKIKKNSALSKELEEAFNDENFDDYDDDKLDEDEDEDDLDNDEIDDFEPSMEDLMGIEDSFDTIIPSKGTSKKSSKKSSSKKEGTEAKPKTRSRKKKSEED